MVTYLKTKMHNTVSRRSGGNAHIRVPISNARRAQSCRLTLTHTVAITSKVTQNHIVQAGWILLNNGLIFVNLLQKSLGVIGAVVLHHLWWIAIVDLDNKFSEFPAHSFIKLLQKLKSSTLSQTATGGNTGE